MSVRGIVGTVPMVFPFWGGFLKDLAAVGAEDVVPETEVLVQE